jgi:hypothetical protein
MRPRGGAPAAGRESGVKVLLDENFPLFSPDLMPSGEIVAWEIRPLPRENR